MSMQINQYVIEPMKIIPGGNDSCSWGHADFYRVAEKVHNELFWISDHNDFYAALNHIAKLIFRPIKVQPRE